MSDLYLDLWNEEDGNYLSGRDVRYERSGLRNVRIYILKNKDTGNFLTSGHPPFP